MAFCLVPILATRGVGDALSLFERVALWRAAYGSATERSLETIREEKGITFHLLVSISF